MQMSSMKRRVPKKMTLPFGSTIEPSLVLIHTIRLTSLHHQPTLLSLSHSLSSSFVSSLSHLLLPLPPFSLWLCPSSHFSPPPPEFGRQRESLCVFFVPHYPPHLLSPLSF